MKRKKRSKNSKKPVALSFKFSDLFSADYRIITALLVILPLLIYLQVYNFEFVWDDNGNSIIGHFKNPFLQNPSWASFTKIFTQQFFGMYIPITYLLWGLLKSIAELLSLPLNSVLHLSNVMVHIVNGLLVFTILKQFVVNKWAVLIGVLFFLLHPIQTEVVAFVSEFRSVLATLFALLSCYYYLKNQANLSYLALIFFILAILSKPSAVVLVPFVFLLNYFHYDFKIAKNIQKTLPFALIALIGIIVAHSVQSKFNIHTSEYAIAFWQRPFAWLDSIVFYLYKIVYPYHLGTSYTLSPKFISVQWWFYPLALVPLALGYLLWLGRKTHPIFVFAAVLFITGFFTTSGFVDFSFQKFSLVADRYVYFAMIGVALAVANLADRKYWQVLLFGVLLIFTVLSAFRQIPIWQNPIKLWSHSMNYEVTPNYARSNLVANFNNTGASLLDLKKYQQARVYFDKAININPKEIEAIYNKSVSYLRQKKYQQALDSFNQTIKINPNYTNAHNGKIRILALLKQCKKAKQAFAFAQQHKVKLQKEIVDDLHKFCP